MPGSLCRFGPANGTGEARIDHTGSIRMFSPRGLDQPAAWPTNDSRTLWPETRGGGVIAVGIRHPNPACSRRLRSGELPAQNFPSDFGGTPQDRRSVVPSKWSETGPVIWFSFCLSRWTAHRRPQPLRRALQRHGGGLMGTGGHEGRGREQMCMGVIWRALAQLGTCGQDYWPAANRVSSETQYSKTLYDDGAFRLVSP
jgi:hypothetical protein